MAGQIDSSGSALETDGGLGTPPPVTTPTAPVVKSTSVAATPAPSLLVTSGASRTAYNSNVSTLGTINSNIAKTNVSAPGTITQGTVNPDGSINNYDPNTGAKLSPGQTVSINPPATKTGTITAPNGNGGSSTTTNAGGSSTAPGAPTQPTTTATPVSSYTNADGSTTSVMSDGSSLIKYSDGSTHAIPAGIDPTIGKMMYDNTIQAQKDAQTASTAVTQATALVTADQNGTNPQAVAAAAEITRQFGILIQQMTDKNNLLMGQNNTSVARYGGLGVMNNNFLNDQSSLAIGRISDLTAQMNDAITKSNQAYASGDLKALQDAQTNYSNAQKEASTELISLQTTISNQVKDNAAAITAANNAQRQKTMDDFNMASDPTTGKALADSIAQAGIGSDPTKVTAFLTQYAKDHGMDPSTVATLQGSLVTAQQQATKDAQTAADTADTIKNRDAGTAISEANLSIAQKKLQDDETKAASDSTVVPVAKLNLLKKQDPTIDVSTITTQSDYDNAVATSKTISSAIDTDASDSTNLGPQGYLTYQYVKNVIATLPPTVDKVGLLTKMYNDGYLTPKLDKHASDYGITDADAKTIMGN